MSYFLARYIYCYRHLLLFYIPGFLNPIKSTDKIH